MLFIVDFDGTISINDTIDVLLELFASKKYLSIEEQWKNNEIGSMECMKLQFELIKVKEDRLKSFLDHVDIDYSFIHFCHYAATWGKIAIASDGIDYPIHKMLERHQISNIPVFANKMHIIDGGVSLSFPYAFNCKNRSGCCKCSVSKTLCNSQDEQIILIGNGQSDTCLADHADFVFAKDSLKEYCLKKGISFHGSDTFLDIVEVMKQWDETSRSVGFGLDKTI